MDQLTKCAECHNQMRFDASMDRLCCDFCKQYLSKNDAVKAIAKEVAEMQKNFLKPKPEVMTRWEKRKYLKEKINKLKAQRSGKEYEEPVSYSDDEDETAAVGPKQILESFRKLGRTPIETATSIWNNMLVPNKNSETIANSLKMYTEQDLSNSVKKFEKKDVKMVHHNTQQDNDEEIEVDIAN